MENILMYPELADVCNLCMEIRADPGTSYSGAPFALDTRTFIGVVTLCMELALTL